MPWDRATLSLYDGVTRSRPEGATSAQDTGGAIEDLLEMATLRRHLAHVDARPLKRLGQNFLVDAGVRDAIVRAVLQAPVDGVVEVGPGPGGLTQGLLAAGARVLALEVDPRMRAVLQDVLGACSNLTVLATDARDLSWMALVADAGRWSLVGNLPYAVTTPLLVRLLPLSFARTVVMVQWEVAERLVAAPGSRTRGAITLFREYHASARILLRVAPGAFYPRPAVTSAVVEFRPRPDRDPHEAHRLRQVVRAAFGQRRKTLRRALAGGLAIPPAAVGAWLDRAQVDGGRRAEELALEDFLRLVGTIPEQEGHPCSFTPPPAAR